MILADAGGRGGRGGPAVLLLSHKIMESWDVDGTLTDQIARRHGVVGDWVDELVNVMDSKVFGSHNLDIRWSSDGWRHLPRG